MQKDSKQVVQEKYSQIAQQNTAINRSSCCGATVSSNKVYNIMSDDYGTLQGYQEDADLGLGCGLPTQFAKLKSGDTVIDLGSGAGNDCFVARHEVGSTGKVLGIDFSESMISRARQNVEKLGYNNVEFRYGDIENMPVTSAIADVVVSNCVLNLVPNKPAVIREIFRVLKPGAHFSISDIVLVGDLPQRLREDAEMYAGCVAGAIQKSDYLQLIQDSGFTNIAVQQEKTVTLPDDILQRYLDADGIQAFKAGGTGIFSITVFGRKPADSPVEISEELAISSQDKGSSDGACC